jgi:hypothetical protein
MVYEELRSILSTDMTYTTIWIEISVRTRWYCLEEITNESSDDITMCRAITMCCSTCATNTSWKASILGNCGASIKLVDFANMVGGDTLKVYSRSASLSIGRHHGGHARRHHGGRSRGRTRRPPSRRRGAPAPKAGPSSRPWWPHGAARGDAWRQPKGRRRTGHISEARVWLLPFGIRARLRIFHATLMVTLGARAGLSGIHGRVQGATPASSRRQVEEVGRRRRPERHCTTHLHGHLRRPTLQIFASHLYFNFTPHSRNFGCLAPPARTSNALRALLGVFQLGPGMKAYQLVFLDKKNLCSHWIS